MENLYFPLFLIALAVVVILVFNKGRTGDSGHRRSAGRPSGRLADIERRPGSRKRLGAAARLESAQGATRGDIWQTKRERAAKETFAKPAPGSAYRATYLGPGPGGVGGGRSAGELKEQGASEAEHLSIGEYLSKAAREEAQERARKAAEEKAGLSMTAMKYDPVDGDPSSDDEEKKPITRAGFKP